jgi:hypothetical protein
MAFLESQQGFLALFATLCGITGAFCVHGGKSKRALGWFGVTQRARPTATAALTMRVCILVG